MPITREEEPCHHLICCRKNCSGYPALGCYLQVLACQRSCIKWYRISFYLIYWTSHVKWSNHFATVKERLSRLIKPSLKVCLCCLVELCGEWDCYWLVVTSCYCCCGYVCSSREVIAEERSILMHVLIGHFFIWWWGGVSYLAWLVINW